MKRLVFSLSFVLFFALFLFTEASAFQKTFWNPDRSSKAKPVPTRPTATSVASSRPPPKRPKEIPQKVPPRSKANTAKTRVVPPRPTESLRSAPPRPRVVAETSRPTTQEYASSETPVATRARYVTLPKANAPSVRQTGPLLKASRQAGYTNRPFQSYQVRKNHKPHLEDLIPESEIPQVLAILKSGWRLVIYHQQVQLTAYDNCKKCTDSGKGVTACSIRAKGNRIIAVDPRYIPYGSIAYITGKHPSNPNTPRGWSFAADACGACRKDADEGKIHIDIHYDYPHAQNERFGNQYQQSLVVLVPPKQKKPSQDPEFYQNMPQVVRLLAGTNITKGLGQQLKKADAYEPPNQKASK